MSVRPALARMAEVAGVAAFLGTTAHLLGTMFADQHAACAETLVYDHDGVSITVDMQHIADSSIRSAAHQLFTVTSFWPDATSTGVGRVRSLLVQVIECLNALAMVERVLDDPARAAPIDAPMHADQLARRGTRLLGQMAAVLVANPLWNGQAEFVDTCCVLQQGLSDGVQNVRMANSRRYM